MRASFLVLPALGLAAFAGCGSDSGGATGDSGATPSATCTASSATATQSVQLVGLAFNPGCVTVTAGTEVTFTNDDSVEHTVTSDAGQAESFDSGLLAPGATFRHTFGAPGTIDAHCRIHPSMHISVVVQ